MFRRNAMQARYAMAYQACGIMGWGRRQLAGGLLVEPSESAGAVFFVGLVVFVVEVYELVVDVLIEIVVLVLVVILVLFVFVVEIVIVVIVVVFVIIEIILVVEVDIFIVIEILVEGLVLEVVISALGRQRKIRRPERGRHCSILLAEHTGELQRRKTK